VRPPAVLVAVASAVAVSTLTPAGATQPTTPIPGPTLTPPSKVSAGLQPPCTVSGDDGPNTLTGTPGTDVICGHGGDDVLQGLDGDDVLDGGDGTDLATYESSPCCVRADLAAGTATGVGTDLLVAMENLAGTPGDDVLRGNAGPNWIAGLGRTDLLYGGDGDDQLLGGNEDDFLAGEAGANALDGGPGADICADGAGASCSPPSPQDGNDTRGPVDVRLVDTGGGVGVWRVAWFGRASKHQLWDVGYAVVSIDSQDGPDFDFHLVARSTGRRIVGLLLRDGLRKPVAQVAASRTGGRGVWISVGLDQVGLGPERAYYRWAVTTMWGEGRCRPCFDQVPGEPGAFPRPLS
jgi:RTX calcium-binding nonapeptide repeat (4 copies)